MYVRTHMYVLMNEHMYVFRVVLTINIYYFSTRYSMIFFDMCKDYVLRPVETGICLVYATLCGWPFRVQVLPDWHTRRSHTQWHISDAVLIQLILLMINTMNHNKLHVQHTYVRTYIYVPMYEHMYMFRVVLTISVYYFPIQYSMIFFVMCKHYVLCAVETEVCRLFVVAETHKFATTNISKFSSPV